VRAMRHAVVSNLAGVGGCNAARGCQQSSGCGVCNAARGRQQSSGCGVCDAARGCQQSSGCGGVRCGTQL
jgi:hypothetical protein